MSVYEKFTFRGRILDRMTIAALLAAEKRLGYDNVIVQGSYNAGVSQSAGTHDGGGAVDLVWRPLIGRENRALRKWGHFAGWPRERIPGLWNRHWHGILIGNDKASPDAKAQVVEYRAGGDGLIGSTRDRFWRPKTITAFDYGRCALVSWKRLNELAASKSKKARFREGRRQVETVARALRGFNMDMPGHKPGRMDKPLTDALDRFAGFRKIGDTQVNGPLGPKVCYELCIPTLEEN